MFHLVSQGKIGGRGVMQLAFAFDGEQQLRVKTIS